MSKPKLITILGTRPEIIRLSRIIPKFDAHFDHVLVHTGQNFDPMLSDVFFEELNVRKPDYFFNSRQDSLANTIADILIKTEALIKEIRPQGLFVLGDTNSSMAAIIAKRMQIPVYHWEAGNRSFDENVPEETNRKIVDHVADFNIAYSNHAAQNLLNEGIKNSRILVSGSPMKEVLDYFEPKISESQILESLGVEPNKYFVASFHRQENVDSPQRLKQIIETLERTGEKYQFPILVSTHPRTQLRIANMVSLPNNVGLRLLRPFGYFDYVKLQQNAFCVISDSGTISEECSILDFPAVTIRDSMERPEALEAKTIKMTGLTFPGLVEGIEWAISARSHKMPDVYDVSEASNSVVSLIAKTITTFAQWSGVRPVISNE